MRRFVARLRPFPVHRVARRRQQVRILVIVCDDDRARQRRGSHSVLDDRPFAQATPGEALEQGRSKQLETHGLRQGLDERRHDRAKAVGDEPAAIGWRTLDRLRQDRIEPARSEPGSPTPP